MKPAETKAIYESACKTRRLPIVQEECREWYQQLRAFDVRDIEDGLRTWWGSTDLDDNGQLKSKWLPAPGELKPLALAAQRKREAAAREPQDVLLWECEGEGHHRYSGFIGRSKLPPASRCRYCNAHMKLVERQVA